MSEGQNMRTIALIVSIAAGAWAQASDAQSRPPMRQHTETDAADLDLVSATRSYRGNDVSIQMRGNTRTITSNGVPDHAVGQFPNRGNPHKISAQRYRFVVPARPKVGSAKSLPSGSSFGVAINGIPFDPNAAEYWQGNPNSGWNYNALGGAVTLGLDANYAHVQPSGAYHYHGLPVALMQSLGWRSSKASPLIGYAADGFPIYALTASLNGRVTKMTSSWQLKSGRRPGGSGPAGRYDGAFVQDYQYVAGSGRLDECNGAMVKTAQYPEGTYAYFLTETFPVVPRCLKGQVGSGFNKR